MATETGAKSAAVAAPRQRVALSRRAFFDGVEREVRRLLPGDLAGFRAAGGGFLLKLSYGNERVHYEVAPDSQRGHVEVALHFEDGPASTVAYLAAFDRHIVELKHDLGTAVELERWTASWGRLYELHPMHALDADLATAVGARLAALIVAAQPVVEAAAVPAEGPRRGGPWRGRRSGG